MTREERNAWFAEEARNYREAPERGRAKESLSGDGEARARAGYDPPGSNCIPPPPDRSSLSIASWLKRDIPPRDYLLGGVQFLKWPGQRRALVMYRNL